MAGTWNYTGHALYRYTGSMTLTQALKENMGDPERRTQYQSGNERRKKKTVMAHGRRDNLSFQEVGLSHSSDEVSVMEMEPRAWVIFG